MSGRITVLVISKHPHWVRQITESIARGFECTILVASTPLSGLEMARQFQPHVIHVDGTVELVEGGSYLELLKDISKPSKVILVNERSSAVAD